MSAMPKDLMIKGRSDFSGFLKIAELFLFFFLMDGRMDGHVVAGRITAEIRKTQKTGLLVTEPV